MRASERAFISNCGIIKCDSRLLVVCDLQAALDSGLRQPLDLPTFIGRVRTVTKLPIAVGFGIKSKADFDKVCCCRCVSRT